jgi:hypothetical protein
MSDSKCLLAILLAALPFQAVCVPMVLKTDRIGVVRFGKTIKQISAHQAQAPTFIEDENSPNGRCAILEFTSLPGMRFMAEGSSKSPRNRLKITAATIDRTITSEIGPTIGDPASSIAHLKPYLGSRTIKIYTDPARQTLSKRQSAIIYFVEGQTIKEIRGGLLPSAAYTNFSCMAW